MDGTHVSVASDDEVVFLVEPIGAPTSESLSGVTNKLERTVGELRSSYNSVVGQIAAVLQDPFPEGDWEVAEAEVSIELSASGEFKPFGIGVDAGAKAGLSLKLVRVKR